VLPLFRYLIRGDALSLFLCHLQRGHHIIRSTVTQPDFICRFKNDYHTHTHTHAHTHTHTRTRTRTRTRTHTSETTYRSPTSPCTESAESEYTCTPGNLCPCPARPAHPGQKLRERRKDEESATRLQHVSWCTTIGWTGVWMKYSGMRSTRSRIAELRSERSNCHCVQRHNVGLPLTSAKAHSHTTQGTT
jgi:hypothetical protein